MEASQGVGEESWILDDVVMGGQRDGDKLLRGHEATPAAGKSRMVAVREEGEWLAGKDE